MSALEKGGNLAELDARYPLLEDYFARGFVLLRLYGVSERSTAQRPVCLCPKGDRCESPGKHTHGRYKTPDGSAVLHSLSDAIEKLPAGKRWNVGLSFAYGAGAECIALDVENDAALDRIRDEYVFDPLEAGCAAKTGRGYHALYKLTPEQLADPAAVGMKQGANAWAVPDVDMRVGGTNGLIVIEPSIHYSQGEYEWLRLEEPGETPAGLLKLAATHQSLRRSEPVEEKRPREKPSSSSNVIHLESAFAEQEREHLERRSVGAVRAAAEKIARQGKPGRHDTNAGQAFALGVTLALRPSYEHDAALYELRQAFYAQPSDLSDPSEQPNAQGVSEWQKSELKGIEEQFAEGVRQGRAGTYRKGLAEPIPSDPVGSSSSPEKAREAFEEVLTEKAAEVEEEAFRPSLRAVRLSELGAPRPVEWLEGDIAEGRIPRGELTIIMGEPGVGKGSITAQIVAEVTNAGRVVIVSAPEDDLERVTLPRYMAAGAKLENVIAIGIEWNPDEPWQPPDIEAHAKELLEAAATHDAALLVLDPTEEHMSADAKVERANRDTLRPLLAGCRDLGCAVLGIDHVNRMNSSSGYQRAGGSSVKYKRARSVLIAAERQSTEGANPAEDALKPSEVVLIHDKCNVGGKAHGLRFEIMRDTVPGANGVEVTTARARLLGETTLTSSEVLGDNARAQSETVAECAAWLRPYLEHRGMGHPAEDTRKDAHDTNPEWKADTLKLAIKQLGGSHGPMGFGGDGVSWGYKLPGYKPLGADRN